MFTSYPITGNNIVETVRYTEPEQSGNNGLVWINQTQYFEGVQPQVWNFCLGGYQICQKWLKDRQGCCLLNEDIQQYQQVVTILKEIIELMAKINREIQQCRINQIKILENVRVNVSE